MPDALQGTLQNSLGTNYTLERELAEIRPRSARLGRAEARGR